MESIDLDRTLKTMFDRQVSLIRTKNIELEREYFTKNSNCIPMSEIMQGTSYEDHFTYFKDAVKNGVDNKISQIFMLLQEYFLFSYGHDMMFKKKLEADMFISTPIEDFIYPKLYEAVKEEYNDISIMRENPNFNKNIENINRLVCIYTEMQSLLYLLYCNEFQFPNGFEEICMGDCEDVLNILNNSGITIGDFLHALIDFKCKTMYEIFSEIGNYQLRKKYLEKVENLRVEKHEETKTFSHVDLPITYFLDNTFSDFMSIERKSSILEDTTAKKTPKILLPK